MQGDTYLKGICACVPALWGHYKAFPRNKVGEFNPPRSPEDEDHGHVATVFKIRGPWLGVMRGKPHSSNKQEPCAPVGSQSLPAPTAGLGWSLLPSANTWCERKAAVTELTSYSPPCHLLCVTKGERTCRFPAGTQPPPPPKEV